MHLFFVIPGIVLLACVCVCVCERLHASGFLVNMSISVINLMHVLLPLCYAFLISQLTFSVCVCVCACVCVHVHIYITNLQHVSPL